MWSNARVREYFRRNIGHSWTSRKPSFLNSKCAYIVTSHSTHRVYLRCLCDCSECDPSGLGLDSWNSSWIIARLKEYLKRKRGYSRLPFKKAELLERQVSLNLHLAYTLRVQTRCSSKCNLKKQKKPPGTNFACVVTSSPRFLPASDSEWPDHLSQRRWRGQTSRFLSMRLRASYSHLGDIGGRKENTDIDGTAPAFGKGPAFPVANNW